MRVRRTVAAGFGALAVGLAAASVAWACTAFSAATALSQGVGAAGDTVTVSGSYFGNAPVTIHWGDARGPVLGTARGPSFSVPVTIPADAASDVFYVVAVGRSQNGDATEVAQTFEVTSAAAGPEPAASTTGPRDLWPAERLTQGLSDPAPSQTGSGMALGVGLLSVGIVVLAGGATAATVARRRAAASTTR